MARSEINRYFVDIRLMSSDENKKSLHVDACSRAGAINQAVKLVIKHKIKDIYAITVREQAYPVEKRKRKRLLKEKKMQWNAKRDNLKAIKSIRMFIANKP